METFVLVFFDKLIGQLFKAGDWNDRDKEVCMSSSGFPCDFTTPGNPPQCDPYSFEGFSYNVYLVSIYILHLF